MVIKPIVFAFALLFALPPLVCAAPTNVLPNPSFESGRSAPDGWTPSNAFAGTWDPLGHDGERCVSVAGDGNDSAWWAAKSVPLESNQLYHLSYWVRSQEGTSGAVIAGLSSVNRDANADSEWQRREFYFRTPVDLTGSIFRVGQWHHKGVVSLDEVSLTPAFVTHSAAGTDMVLGSGELIANGRYSARHQMDGPGSTDFRCLDHFTVAFNSDRWDFGTGEVVYHYAVNRLPQTDAEVEVNVNLYARGALVIEASRDQSTWVTVGEVKKQGRVTLPIPTEVLPARDVYIRLRASGGASLQVNDYEYDCRLPEAPASTRTAGKSQYLSIEQQSPNVDVQLTGLGDLLPAGRNTAEMVVTNHGPRRSFALRVAIEKEGDGVSLTEQDVVVASDSFERASVAYEVGHPDAYTVRLTCAEADGTAVWEAKGDFMVPPLHDSGGELLSDTSDFAVWWCEPERKISRTRSAPVAKGAALRIGAAGNEYEPAQLVLTPRRALSGCRLTAADLVSDSGARIAASEIEIRLVDYVFVEHPTDSIGSKDEWPDPLPPVRGPVDLAAGRNQPFWITVHVPAGTPAGDYRGGITIDADGASTQVPMVVHVWGFDLPNETHVRSGFGFSMDEVKRYHNLTTEAETRQVLDLYLRSFASHRIAPYWAGRPIDVTWKKGAKGQVEPVIDFTAFDADARYMLDELGFNSFSLDLPGMGGGTFYSREIGEIAGLKRGTPEHEAAFTTYVRAVRKHLADRGWLKKAYVYWFDEPEPKDFDFVRDGMQLIHRAAPDFARFLTTQPDSRLFGAVDIWCLQPNRLDPKLASERSAAGEQLWWYLCTGPKEPYFTLFLDHYGTEMRLWLWETWKYKLSGVLVWQTNYWTSDTAYPRPAMQNPWQDPMSWTSGYGVPKGSKEPWGNGDGRFFYPPNRDPNDTTTAYLEGPVPSIRWEMLRDGMEDYEYFWLLRAEIDRLRNAGADPAIYRDAEKLLEVPADVCADLAHFTFSPEPMHAHRAKLAAAIEALRRSR